MQIKKLYMVWIIDILITFSACKKFVDISVPDDRVISDRVFTDDAKATSAVTGIYGNMINGSASFANSLTSIYAGMSADELTKFNAAATEEEFMFNNLTPSNSVVATIWKLAYQSIYYSNANLEGLQTGQNLSPLVKSQLTGECKFIRALCYFYLVNFYGDVPLVTTTSYSTNAKLPRASRDKIYELIISDLIDAKSNLPATSVTSEKVRPNKWAAIALLARVYLYNQNWAGAESESSEVIEAGIYSPLPSLANTFLKNSKEAIWQLIPNSGVLKETQQIRPSSSLLTPQIVINNSFIQAFELGDGRRTKWIDSVTYAGTVYYYPSKYKNTSTTVTEYYTVLRLSEQYLIRAEAKAQQAKVTEGIRDVNVIRNRAGLSNLPTILTQDELVLKIDKERKTEFFAEWGHRWFDLKRTGKANTVLGTIKPNWQTTDTLYPIPLEEILNNSYLTQNAGY